MNDQHIETVNHLKKKLDKGVSFEKTMHILYKLQKIPISVKLLEETGIGYKLRELSKQEKNNDVGKTAKLLIMAWKQFLKDQEDQQHEDDSEESEVMTNNRHHHHHHHHHQHHHRDRERHQHQNNMDSDDNGNIEKFDDGDQVCDDMTPRSDKSEESVSPQHGSSSLHKKKHKKKKKKTKENNSDDEREEKKEKKDKKRKHRENDSTERNDSTKRHKSSEYSSRLNNKCDKIVNGNSNHSYNEQYSQCSKQGPNETKLNNHNHYHNSKNGNSSSSQHRYFASNDMFSSVLNMGDQFITSKNTGKTTSSGINRNKHNSNGESIQMNYYPSSSATSNSNFDKEIMHSLTCQTATNRYDPNMYQYYQPQRSNNYEADRNLVNMAGMKFKGRTQVYAGSSKVVTVHKVYRLQDICIKVLMNHLNKIYEVGDLPYFILKPVFAKCTVQQLRRIEHYNPQLMEDTDELWGDFCEKDFRNKQLDRKHFDSWRDFYNYLVEEREEKLKNITRNISSKQRQALPERKTQQIDLKTPREIRRRQERNFNTPFPFSNNKSSGTSSGISVKSSLTAMNQVSNKSKPAPLMKKLLQMRHSKFRR